MGRAWKWLKTQGWVILVIAVVAGLSILKYAPWTTWPHDSAYHVANTTAVVEALESGTGISVLPEIAENLGYGSGIFYSQLFHVLVAGIAVVLSPLTTNIYFAFWLGHFLVLFCSGLLMYLLVKKILEKLTGAGELKTPRFLEKLESGTKKIFRARKDDDGHRVRVAALVSACFYVTATYHLVDILVRDAQAEASVFLFLPMILLGLWYLFNGLSGEEKRERWKFYPWFIVGYAGLFYSHLALTMYLTILLAIVFLVNYRRVFTQKFLKPFLLATGAVVMLVLPFIVMLLEQVQAGEYRVFAEESMAGGVPASGYLYDYFSFAEISTESGFPITLNFAMVLLAVVALILIRKNKLKIGKGKFLTTALAVLIFGSVVIMLHIFPWVIVPDVLKMLQFPWRLNVFLVFGLAIAGGIGFYLLKPNSRRATTVLVAVFCAVSVIQVNEWENLVRTREIDYATVWEETELATLGMGWQWEYLPEKAYENWAEVAEIGEAQRITQSGARIGLAVLENQTPNLTIRTSEATGTTTLEIPRLFYVGYSIVATDENGEEREIIYRESERGLIEFEISENATVEIKFTGTQIDRVAQALAGATAVTGAVCVCFAWQKTRKRKGKNGK